MLGDVTPAAVADPDEGGQGTGPSAGGTVLRQRLRQAECTRSLFFAEVGDQLLKALLRCHTTYGNSSPRGTGHGTE